MIVVPLGTSSAAPTLTRHLSATAFVNQGYILLFDCGEGTQLRLQQCRLKHSRIEAIFITHLHGDHYFGLMGLLSSMALARRTARLVIVAPEALSRLVHLLPGIREEELPFPVEYVPLREGMAKAVVYDRPDLYVEARAVDHRVFSVGYRVQEKPRPPRIDAARARMLGVTDYTDFVALKRGQAVQGSHAQMVTPEEVLIPGSAPRAFAYVVDTRPCEGAVQLARNATLLMHEATFSEALRKRAHDTAHSTARQAAMVAKRAGARRLLLCHFSSRYRELDTLVAEARAVFEPAEAAEELRSYPLEPYADES